MQLPVSPRRPTDTDFGYLSYIYGRMAESYDALGQHEHAIDYYSRFVERWKEADPELQPRVEAARKRLAELVSERDEP